MQTINNAIDAIEFFKLNCYYNMEASEPRWEVSPGYAWKPTFNQSLEAAVMEWIVKYGSHTA